ncbi:hypothetical protein ACLMMR_38375, partial [Streptomyces sp. NPDC000405]
DQDPYLQGYEAVDLLWLYRYNRDMLGGGRPVRERMSGNLCRCSAYTSIVEAVARAAEADASSAASVPGPLGEAAA